MEGLYTVLTFPNGLENNTAIFQRISPSTLQALFLHQESNLLLFASSSKAQPSGRI